MVSFAYLKNKFKKEKEGEEETPEIVQLEVENEERKKEEEEALTQMMVRMNEIENDIPRIKVSIDTLKAQIQEIRDEVESLNKTIRDVMMLYEVVSQEINPFKDLKSENPIVGEIQDLKQEFDELRKEMAQIKADLRLLAYHAIDLDKVIYEVLVEGEK